MNKCTSVHMSNQQLTVTGCSLRRDKITEIQEKKH